MLSVMPDAVVTNAATPVTINVLANDSGTGLTITSFSNPANGSLVFNVDKTFTYTPTTGFVGTDGFAYTVRDAQGTPANAEVTISVIPGADTTVAIDDAVEVVAGNAVVIPVLANDMPDSGGSLQIVAVSMPGHGTINLLADQSIRYLPQSGFTGIDSFTYTVAGGQGGTATATVTIKVLAQNSPPVAGNDTFTIQAGQPTVLAVLANDSDPDGGPLQVVGFTMPSHGSLVFNVDKTFTYTPAAGHLGTDQFTYTIRDNRGASAVATVTLAVVEVTEAPVAADDQVTTEAGVPVTIDVLANDTLPAGQQIAIVAVSLPYRGKLAFNPNKTITYTPNAGFVGMDDFTYTISNGKGGTAKASVTVEVTPATVITTYANGYAHRRRIVVPTRSAKGGSHQNFPLWVELSGPWLRSASHGGKVASADGHDLRFELLDGTKLAHELERYDAAAGELGAWVRLPELSDATATALHLYYDKPGLTQSEAAPRAVWSDYLAVWHLPGTLDASAAGRLLNSAGSLAGSDEGLGAGALSLNGNGVLSIEDTSWLNGRSAVSIQLRGKAQDTGSDRGLLNAGGFGSDAASDLALRYQAVGFAGNQPANVIHTKLKTTAGNVGASSAAGTQSTAWQSLAFEWASGDARPDLYLDGHAAPLSYTNQISGPATTQITGPLYLGAGPRDSATGGWAGLIDEVRFRAGKLGAAWLAAEHANQGDAAGFFGLGAEEAFGDDGVGIVAIPLAVETDAGQWIDIDVLAAAVPADMSGATIQAVTQPASGTASVVGTKIRYVPMTGRIGTDSFTYRLEANGKSSTAPITVEVKSSVSQGQSGGADEIPQSLRIVTVTNQSQLDAAKAAAIPGDHLVLANGSYNLGNVAASGTVAAPIVIRAQNNQAVTLTGLGSVTGDNVRLWGFDCGNNNFGMLTGRNTWIIRCQWSGNSTGNRIRLRAPGGRVWYCKMTGNGRMISFDTGANAGGAGLMGIQGHVKGCWFHDVAPGGDNATEVITVGFANNRTDVQCDTIIEKCLFEDCNLGGQEDETIAIKGSFVTVRNCTFIRSRFCQNRHGRHNLIEGCWHEDSPAGGFSIWDGPNVMQNCKTVGGSRTTIGCGNGVSQTESASTYQQGTSHARAYQVKVYHHDAVNTAPVIGFTFSTPWDPLFAADQTIWLQNRGVAPSLLGPVSGKPRQTGTNQAGMAPIAYEAPQRLSSAQVGVSGAL